MDRVLLDLHDHVAHVRLNRPDKRNGLDPAMFEAILAVGEQLRADRRVRAVVLSGEGPAFCAGLDWPAFLALGPAGAGTLLARPHPPANVAQRVGWIWQEIEAPVIAVVHGAAFGGGLQLALGADLRYAARDVKLAVMEIRYGLVPDMGITRTLTRVVRDDVVRELVFTGRTVEADEALRLGLVTRVCDDPLAEALATARAIAARSPDAVRAAKRMLGAAADLDVAGAFRLETDLQLGLLGTPNQVEAVTATMTRREPVFTDPEPR